MSPFSLPPRPPLHDSFGLGLSCFGLAALLLYYYTLSLSLSLSQPQLSFAKSCLLLLSSVARHPFRVSKMGIGDKTKREPKRAKMINQA